MVFFTDEFAAVAKGRKLIHDWPVFKSRQRNFFDLPDKELNFWIEEFKRMEQEYKTRDEFRSQALFYSIGNLLVRASRLQKGTKVGIAQGSDFLFQFQELIEQNFLKLKLPKEYAEILNLTPNYLNSLCKKVSGKSAGELIRQRVLLEAKRLLAHTSLTVSEIAFQLGFEDNSYFGRFFTKYTGSTPASFRESQKF
jgi:AraC-like DNA-binding protein